MASDEQLVAIVSFTGAVKREVAKLRAELATYEGIGTFRLDIECAGRVLDGDVKISFKLGESYDSSQMVEGNDVSKVAEEFIRRHNWKKRNAPLLLTATKTPEALESEGHDGIPF